MGYFHVQVTTPLPLFLMDDFDGAPMDVDQPDDDSAPRKQRQNLDGRNAPSMTTREELDGFSKTTWAYGKSHIYTPK